MAKSKPKVSAVFLDRDGTIIEDVGFLTSAERIRILPNTASGLRSLREAGFRLVVVTNQSAVARGMLDEEQLEEIHKTLARHLEMLGAGVDAFYWCPHLPDEPGALPEYAVECDCRKPKPGLILRAAAEMNIDLSASWVIGDNWRDMEAGQAAGCKTIKLPEPPGQSVPRPSTAQPPTAEAKNINEASEIILAPGTVTGEAVKVAEVAEEPAPVEAEEPTEEPEPQREPARPEPVTPETPPQEPEKIQAVAQEEPAEHVADETPPEEPPEEVLMVELADERQADLPVETQDVAPVPVRLEMEQADAETVEAEVEEGEEPVAPASVPEVTAARPEEARTLRCARCGAAVTAEQAESIDEPGGPGRWHGKLVCSECLVKVKAIDADGGEGLEPHEQQRVLLQRVLHEVRRLARRTEAEPFSLLRLFAYLAMIVSLFVGLVLVIVVEQKGLFIQMGILLMLLALTLFIIEKKR